MQCSFFFFFNDTATTEIYTLSLHDALPISRPGVDRPFGAELPRETQTIRVHIDAQQDRKSTRLNSSHLVISYAVFCLKKKTRSLLAITLVPIAYLICTYHHQHDVRTSPDLS